LIQGNLEAIVSKDCLWNLLPDKGIIGKLNHSCHLGIKDSRNRIFPVEIDQECRTHIFNSVELCLIDYLPQLSKMGLDNLIIDARNKPVNYIQNILPIYQKAREFTVNSVPNLGNKLDLLKKRVKKNSNGGITTGNFIRGVEND
jgi:putative protease